MDAALSRPRKDRWNWVERAIWTDQMLMALENGVKGNQWFSLIDKATRPATLLSAWQQVAKNKGAAGIDKISIKAFSQNQDRYLRQIKSELEQGTYIPSAIRRTYIPKTDGKKRPLGIPVIKDRVVQTAIKMTLEPIWENEFLPSSYGFRPQRSAHDAIHEVTRLLKDGHQFVVDADIKGYFDNISHSLMMDAVNSKIADGKINKLIERFMEASIIEETKEWKPTCGTPQGGVLSPLLANIFLHSFDVLMKEQCFKMIRYADDFVILCKTANEAERVLNITKEWMQKHLLELHPDKTRICDYRAQGFDFLGFTFENGYKFVRKSSYSRFKEAIREKTRRTCGKSAIQIVNSLNPMLVGWFNYFKPAQGSIYKEIDCFIRRRVRAVLRKHKKCPGSGRARKDHINWPNEYFAKLGLFSLLEARAIYFKLANQPK